MNTVSLCMICKNEEANISRLMDEVCPILEDVLIVDTGSTDRTLSILEEKQKQYSNLRVDHFEWTDNFSEARNYAFSKALPGTSFYMFLDSDDSVSPSDLKVFKDSFLVLPDVDCWLLDYNYSFYPDGTPSIVLGRERFMRKSCNPTWVGAIHEVVNLSGMRQRHYNELKINHMHQGNSRRAADPLRNIRILKKEFDKNPNDARTAYYYGKELFDHCDSKGIEILEHYLTLSGRYFDDSVNGRYRLGCHYLANKNHRKALDQAYEIYNDDFCRERAEGYFLGGMVEQDLGNFKVAIEWFEKCLRCNPLPPRVLNREVYTWHPWKRMAECYIRLNNFIETKKCVDEVLKKLPNDQNMINWSNSLRATIEPINDLKIVELGTDSGIRLDSRKCRNMTDNYMPFRDEELDGIITYSVSNAKECYRVIKPGGFLWINRGVCTSEHHWEPREGFNFLGACEYGGVTIHNFVRSNPSLPSIGYSWGNDTFGPHRIRITNAIKSAIKQGHLTIEQNMGGGMAADVDIFLGKSLFGGERAKLKILDVCELLNKDYYDHIGIKHANVVIACSTKLSEHIKELYPEKNMIVVNDHFELTDTEWQNLAL